MREQRLREDKYNRGRRNDNIRVRGLPETSESEDVRSILQTVFNNILGCPCSTPIKLDRASRGLNSAGSSSYPQDIIC